MKKLTYSLLVLALAAATMVSCEKQPTVNIYQGIVTVKTVNDSCRLQLNDTTVLVPQNQARNPYGRQVRALTTFENLGVLGHIGGTEYRSVKLYTLDSILTKTPVPDLGSELNPEVYGDAAIDVYVDWMSVLEDKYITLHFRGKWGDLANVHTVSLVKTDDPYTFELRHNLNGDDTTFGYYVDGIVAYDIDYLIDGSKTTYDIKISHNSEDGVKSFYFHYTPGTSAPVSTE